jgi:calpain-15
VVVIDDCFPCLKSGELVFSKAHRKQLWVPLIEKALAKLYGSYEALNAGRVLLGLSVLTGLPCEKIHLKKPSSKDGGIDQDLIWARLLSYRERGFPMSASCGGDRDEESLNGLESNHAYSLLDVRQLGNERLVRLRNPWGKYSWKGSWSDKDSRWSSQPWLREELQAVGGEAGVFWMAAQDFFKYFCEVDVCKYRPNWHSVRSEGKLLPYAARQIKTLAFDVHTTTEVDISIYQPSSRGRSNRHNLVDMTVLVLRYAEEAHNLRNPSSHPPPLPTACSLHSGSHIQSIVTAEGFLTPGRYMILPLAFNHYRHTTGKGDGSVAQEGEGSDGVHHSERRESDIKSEKGSVPYVVAVFSAQELAYENVTTRPGFLPESLMLLAEKIGKVTQSFPNMLLYEVYMRHSCRYLVAVNMDRRHHFTVTCDGRESGNVICSRGTMYTEDCIPPKHRQILWVLTQLEGSSSYSVMMRISSTCTRLNSHGQWGAHHSPPLNSTTAELHAPRLII